MKLQKEFLEKFPSQIQYAVENYVRHNFMLSNYKSLVLGGLGGSGIAAHIVKNYFRNACPVPVEVISEYHLPAYVDENTLVILSSYSGNTEETLGMYIDALEKGASILVITTGGLLLELAEENGIQCYMAEKGFQPRMALGYSLSYLLLIFSELLNQNQQNNIKSICKHLFNTDAFLDKAKTIFNALAPEKDQKLIIVTEPNTHAIGLRFAQQIQENAKHEAFVHEIPEANHNVIETYYSKLNSVFLILNSTENPKINLRIEFLIQLLLKNKQKVYEYKLAGFALKEIIDTIYTLDWTSLYLSDNKGINSLEIQNIKKLKEHLKSN
jgi:glucose/mannose-6-phosphate isomerase